MSEPEHTEIEVDIQALRWMCDIVSMLNTVGNCVLDYGDYSLGDIEIRFDGESNSTNFLIRESEFDGKYALVMKA